MTSQFIQVEVSKPDGGDLPVDDNAAGGDAVIAGFARVSGDALVSAVRETVELIGEAFTPREGGLESCVIKFGLKVSGAGNVILAKMGSELNLEVTLAWKR